MPDSAVLHIAGEATLAPGDPPARLLETPDGAIVVLVGVDSGLGVDDGEPGAFATLVNATAGMLALTTPEGVDGPDRLPPGETVYPLVFDGGFATLAVQGIPTPAPPEPAGPAGPAAPVAVSIMLSAERGSGGAVEFVGQLFSRLLESAGGPA